MKPCPVCHTRPANEAGGACEECEKQQRLREQIAAWAPLGKLLRELRGEFKFVGFVMASNQVRLSHYRHKGTSRNIYLDKDGQAYAPHAGGYVKVERESALVAVFTS